MQEPTKDKNPATWLPALGTMVALFGYELASFLVLDDGTTNLSTRNVTVPARLAVILLTAIAALKHTRNPSVAPNQAPMLIFALLYTIRITHTWLSGDASRYQPIDYMLYWLGICLIPAFFASLAIKALNHVRAFNLILLATTAVCAMALIQQATSGGMTASRMRGNIALNMITLGRVGACALALVITRTIVGNRVSFLRNAIYWACALAGGLVVLLANSRGPLLSLVLTIAIVLVTTFGRRALPILILAPTPAILSAWALASLAPERIEQVIGRFEIDSDSESMDDSRLSLWRETIKLIAENPVMGAGIELAGGATPHNLVLEGFLSTGILGGIAMCAALSIAILQALKLLRTRAPGSWIVPIFFVCLFNSLVSGAVYAQNTLWVCVFLLAFLQEGAIAPSGISSSWHPSKGPAR